MSKFNTKNFPLQRGLTKDDTMIILGDCGSLTWDLSKETLHNRQWLASRNFTTAFVDGNHDNHTMLDQLPTIKKWGGTVGVIDTPSGHIYHLKRGEVYSIDEKRILTVGGATSRDKEFRMPERTWWEREILSVKEEHKVMDVVSKNNKFDYVLTHTAPLFVEHKLYKHLSAVVCPVARFFTHLDKQISYKQWFFGHHHLDEQISPKHTCLWHTIKQIGD